MIESIPNKLELLLNLKHTFQDGRGDRRDGGVEALALARDAERPEDGGLQEGCRRVLPLHRRDGRQEGRQDLQRPLRGTLRGRREQAEALRALLRPRGRRQALPLRRRSTIQPVEVRPNILLLVCVSAVHGRHRNAPPKD